METMETIERRALLRYAARLQNELNFFGWNCVLVESWPYVCLRQEVAQEDYDRCALAMLERLSNNLLALPFLNVKKYCLRVGAYRDDKGIIEVTLRLNKD